MPSAQDVLNAEISTLNSYVYTFQNNKIAFNQEEHALMTLESVLKKLADDLDWLKNVKKDLTKRHEDGVEAPAFEDGSTPFERDFENYKTGAVPEH